MKKILITGATGFIGTNLIPQLIKNHKIVGISKNKIKSSKNFISSSIDITNENLKIKNKFTDIIHMAAHSDVTYCNLNPTKCYELNVKSTQKMLEIARKNDSSFVFLSSSHVYGDPNKQSISENSSCNPSTHYASSKRMSEILCETYAKTYGLDIQVARLFSVYGPKSSKSNLIFRYKLRFDIVRISFGLFYLLLVFDFKCQWITCLYFCSNVIFTFSISVTFCIEICDFRSTQQKSNNRHSNCSIKPKPRVQGRFKFFIVQLYPLKILF